MTVKISKAHSKSGANYDPFSGEIVRNSIEAICDEMFTAFRKAAMSSVIYEVLDFGVAVTDGRGRLAGQGAGIPVFVGMLAPAVRAILHKFGPAGDIHAGDVFITNDPWAGGASHLNDVSLLMPVVHECTIVAWVADKAHWSDIGGMAPGSISTDCVELYQEGLQFPNIKIIERGRPIQSMIDTIAANSRIPDYTLGDMWAGIAALRMGERRFRSMVERYGADTVERALEEAFDGAEATSRRALADLPKGTFNTEGILEGIGRVRVGITITDDSFVVDLTGNPGQVEAPSNCPYDVTLVGAQTVFKAVTSPTTTCNVGTFRPLRLICDPCSLYNAARPAPVGFYHEPLMFVIDLMWKALAPALPERLTAGHFGSVCALVIGGTHPETGHVHTMIEPEVGGWGAGIGKDGENGQFAKIDGETYNTPVEVNEAKNGIFVEQYAFHGHEGGEGKFNGGKGVYLDYRIRADDAWLLALFTPYVENRPWGMLGGRDGSSNAVRVIRNDGGEELYGKVTNLKLDRGDLVRVVTGNGGGCGDPRKRPREKVMADLKNGYITRKQAAEVYGLALE